MNAAVTMALIAFFKALLDRGAEVWSGGRRLGCAAYPLVLRSLIVVSHSRFHRVQVSVSPSSGRVAAFPARRAPVGSRECCESIVGASDRPVRRRPTSVDFVYYND